LFCIFRFFLPSNNNLRRVETTFSANSSDKGFFF
jgi:hypothetical protein